MKQLYLVEGMYDDEPQFTGDLVFAESESEAEARITVIREFSVTSGSWEHARTALMADELASIQELIAKSTEESVEKDLQALLTEFDGVVCSKCKKVGSVDETEDGICDSCSFEVSQ